MQTTATSRPRIHVTIVKGGLLDLGLTNGNGEWPKAHKGLTAAAAAEVIRDAATSGRIVTCQRMTGEEVEQCPLPEDLVRELKKLDCPVSSNRHCDNCGSLLSAEESCLNCGSDA